MLVVPQRAADGSFPATSLVLGKSIAYAAPMESPKALWTTPKHIVSISNADLIISIYEKVQNKRNCGEKKASQV